jgi:anti-anti-sigma regulatory factor
VRCPGDFAGSVVMQLRGVGVDGAVVHLDLAGEVRGTATANQLATLIVDAVVVDIADELIIDLGAVGFLDAAGVWALFCGYETALQCGIVYRVVHAGGQPCRAFLAIGILDVRPTAGTSELCC